MLFALERQKKILEILESEGSVAVSKLATEFQVTEETIRRDLEKLEKQDSLQRTHGGAIPLLDTTLDISLEKRKRINVDLKQKLAERCVEFIVPGDTVFLDASTTTFCIAKAIKKMTGITVITNSIRVVDELSGCENIKLIAVGGLVSNNQSFIGNVAEENIEKNYFASKMFFSGKGITETAGILDSNETECAIKQKMLKNAKTKYFVCDKSKIGRVGFVKLATFAEIDFFITDADLEESYKNSLEDAEVKIIKA